MQPSTLLSLAAFAANHCPPLPLLPPSRHCLHHHHRGQTHHHLLPKKEVTAAAPPAYQWQHQCENVTSPDNLDLFNLTTVFDVCNVG
jgi:hypothetical protein